MNARSAVGVVAAAERTGSAAALPRHVAIIMDGNGRWAAARGLPRVEGHRRGVEAVRRTLRAAGEFGIEVLTLYSFSLENWSRPASEIDYLMALLRRFIREDLAEMNRANIQIRVIGERTGLSADIAALLNEAVALTAGNTGLKLVMAFNYGARQEIAAAVRSLAEQVAAGTLTPAAVTPELVERALGTAGIPDPDLVIRTSGEQRLSNFLLWQTAYSELVFLPVLWPDFDRAALETALREYGARERRFGGTVAG
jgi:undecaprenyl diphosphate synthase